jgi:hypothetical protein
LGFLPLWGFDVSPVAIAVSEAICAERKGYLKLLCRDATDLCGIPDNSVSLIYCRNAAQYLDYRRLASGVRRVLRSGGAFVAEMKSLRGYYCEELLGYLAGGRWRRALYYGSVVARTSITVALNIQPRWGAKSAEICWTNTIAKRFADIAGVERVRSEARASFSGDWVKYRRR